MEWQSYSPLVNPPSSQPVLILLNILQNIFSRSTGTAMNYTWSLTDMTFLFLSSPLPEYEGKAITIQCTTK